MTNTTARVTLEGDDRPLRQTLRQALGEVKSFSSDAAASMSKSVSSADSLKRAFVGLAGAVSVAGFSAWIKSSIDVQDEMSKMAAKAGITTEAFSELAYAAKFSDVSTEELGKTFSKMASLLAEAKRGNEDAVALFKQLKIDPKNIEDSDQLLQQLVRRFSELEPGAARTALAIEVFGEKLGPRLIPFLTQGEDGLRAMREEAHRLGVVVDSEAGAAAEAFNDDLERLRQVLGGVANQIAGPMVRSLGALIREFAEATRRAGVFRGTLLSLGSIGARMLGIDEVGKLEDKARATSYAINATMAAIERIETRMKASGTTTAPPQLAQLREQLARLQREALETSDALKKVADATYAEYDPPPAPVTPSAMSEEEKWGPKEKKKTPKPKAAPAEPSFMQYYELELAERRRVQSEHDALREFSKQQELGYWQELLKYAQLGGNDRVAIQRKVSQLEVDVRRQAARDQSAVDAESLRAREALMLGEIEGKRTSARMLLDMDKITKLEYLQLEMDFELQRYEVQRAALQERMQLLAQDPNTNPVEKEKLLNQILQLEQQHELRRKQLIGQGEKEGGGLGGMFNGLADSFGRALDGMLARTSSWSDALSSVMANVRGMLIRNLVTEPFSQWLANQAKMLAVRLGFIGKETAMEGTAAATKATIKTQEAGTVVSANAAEAGSGAASALAGIPIVGPALALAAMAAMFAAVMGMGSKVKSASKGYDIPSGLNPMTQLHEEEMVLPAKLANAVRDMAGEGAGREAGDTHHWHVQAIDPRSFERYLNGPGSEALGRAMNLRKRNNKA
nr:hypothetical protein [uncultured Caldimonas sp.]